jgi:hypothetical protein
VGFHPSHFSQHPSPLSIPHICSQHKNLSVDDSTFEIRPLHHTRSMSTPNLDTMKAVTTGLTYVCYM